MHGELALSKQFLSSCEENCEEYSFKVAPRKYWAPKINSFLITGQFDSKLVINTQFGMLSLKHWCGIMFAHFPFKWQGNCKKRKKPSINLNPLLFPNYKHLHQLQVKFRSISYCYILFPYENYSLTWLAYYRKNPWKHHWILFIKIQI